MNAQTHTLTQACSTDAPRRRGLPGAFERRLINAGFRLTSALQPPRPGASRSRSSPANSTAPADQEGASDSVRPRSSIRAESTRCRRSSAVPIRTYEALWDEYLARSYPVFENLTWPGRIPYIALSSGTSQGPTKFIPVSGEMVQLEPHGGAARCSPGTWAPGRARGCLTAGSACWEARPNLETRRSGRAPGRPERDRGGRGAPAASSPTRSRRLSSHSNRTGTARSRDWPRRPA